MADMIYYYHLLITINLIYKRLCQFIKISLISIMIIVVNFDKCDYALNMNMLFILNFYYKNNRKIKEI